MSYIILQIRFEDIKFQYICNLFQFPHQQQMQQMLVDAPGVELDYAVVVNTATLRAPAGDESTVVALVAARVGDTRLIDNQILQLR